jgi:hypothetical protein
MKRALAITVAAGLLSGLGACLNWSDDIPCRSDLHCVEGYTCSAEGVCVSGQGGLDASVVTDGGPRDGGGGRG